MKREVEKTGQESKFLGRLWEQNRRKYRSQAKLAGEVGVARSTVAGWFAGNSVPGMHDLKKLAQVYGVSTDYFLGLTDTENPNVTARAAVAYTGLSEAAIMRLHIGIDEIGCGLLDRDKRELLSPASELIACDYFPTMIDKLGKVNDMAYKAGVLNELEDRYLSWDSFLRKRTVDRAVVPQLKYLCEKEGFFVDETTSSKIDAMDDEGLITFIRSQAESATEKCERYQFLAAKALNSYIDQVVKDNVEKAKRKFGGK